MFCPNCGQQRSSEATKFCSRCGYLLTGTADLLQLGGELPSTSMGKGSPRSTGIRHGIFMILLAIVLVPLLGILLTFGLGMRTPWPIGLVLFLLGGGGVLRIAYALLFEAGGPQALLLPANDRAPSQLTGKGNVLPSLQTPSAADYDAPGIGHWQVENELEPTSVTENTTKLLEKDAE